MIFLSLKIRSVFYTARGRDKTISRVDGGRMTLKISSERRSAPHISRLYRFIIDMTDDDDDAVCVVYYKPVAPRRDSIRYSNYYYYYSRLFLYYNRTRTVPKL